MTKRKQNLLANKKEFLPTESFSMKMIFVQFILVFGESERRMSESPLEIFRNSPFAMFVVDFVGNFVQLERTFRKVKFHNLMDGEGL